jgi:MFS family permease
MSASPNLSATQTSSEPTTAEKLRRLRWSIWSNALNNVFAQYTFFGSVFVLFLDALNLDKGQIGFLISLLPFAGLLSLFTSGVVERFGYKRTYIIFWLIRTVIGMGLILTPWMMARFGSQIALLYVGGIIALFAVARAIGMTASLPWVQEYVPDSVRGKYTASNNAAISLSGFIAITAGSFLLNRTSGLEGFTILQSVGIVASFACTGLALLIPGGAPRPRLPEMPRQRFGGDAFRDGAFRQFLLGVGLLTVATVPLGTFVPLFMREQVGLNTGDVVLLQVGTLGGGILFSYAWGWAADRYGSKPVMQWGLLLRILLPILWLTMPRFSEISLYYALGIALLMGMADMGWGVGSARLLYAGIVPPSKRADYMGTYNAWIGVVGGSSQIFGGWLLTVSAGFGWQLGFFSLDQYFPIFVLGFLLSAASLLVLNRIHADETVSMSGFAGIFFRGNSFLAMTSMIRFHLARGEEDTVRMTEQLSVAKSPLAVDELLEALYDPRFNVRFEAVISIARMPANPRLTQALIEILHGSELALSVVAAWALGRSGTGDAYDPLCQGLDSPFRSIQAHCARALGALGRPEVIPLLLERLTAEQDAGLQMAYASALGNLAATQAAPTVLTLLRGMENEGARMELGLSLARMAGDEHHYVHLLRSFRSDPGTAVAQELLSLKRRIPLPAEQAGLINRCVESFAKGQLAEGAALFRQILEALTPASLTPTQRQILTECAARLAQTDPLHPEYIFVSLAIFHA